MPFEKGLNNRAWIDTSPCSMFLADESLPPGLLGPAVFGVFWSSASPQQPGGIVISKAWQSLFPGFLGSLPVSPVTGCRSYFPASSQRWPFFPRRIASPSARPTAATFATQPHLIVVHEVHNELWADKADAVHHRKYQKYSQRVGLLFLPVLLLFPCSLTPEDCKAVCTEGCWTEQLLALLTQVFRCSLVWNQHHRQYLPFWQQPGQLVVSKLAHLIFGKE